MKIYHYHYLTSEYVCESEADESPLEPGIFLIPSYATDIKPNIKPKKGFAVVFDGEKWVHVVDYRGEIWYNKEGIEVSIDSLGNPEEVGLFKTNPVPPKEEELPKPISPEEASPLPDINMIHEQVKFLMEQIKILTQGK